MRMRGLILALAALAFVTAAGAHEGHAGAQGKGVINTVDAGAHKVNMSHGAIPELGWPAMRMDFAVDNAVDLKSVQPGAGAEFTLEKKDGAYEIHSIKPVAAK